MARISPLSPQVWGLFTVILVSLLVYNAALPKSQQLQGWEKGRTCNGRDRVVASDEAMSKRLSRAIQFKTISYDNYTLMDGEAFLGMHAFFREAFPLLHKHLKAEVVNKYSLLYTWEGTDKSLKPYLLASHLDVVPVDEETRGEWKHDPFGGEIIDGFINGRGSMDDKLGVLAIMESVEDFLAAGRKPARKVYLAFGHDEEVMGTEGAKNIAALLKSRNVHVEFVLDEGMTILQGLLPGASLPVAVIGLAEKGFAVFEMTVTSPGGHSSMPPVEGTAIGTMAEAIRRLEQNQMKAQFAGAVKDMFEVMCAEVNFGFAMIFCNLWAFDWPLTWYLGTKPESNALTRTTTAVTIIDGGTKNNVLPNTVRAVVNHRVAPFDSVASTLAHDIEVVGNPQVKFQMLQSLEPSSVSSRHTEAYEHVARSAKQAFNGVTVAPGLMLGATDTKNYLELTDNIYRFCPMELTKTDVGRLHGFNERLSVTNYGKIVNFYYHLMKNLDSTLCAN